MEIKAVKALATKKGRRESGRFMAEGIRLLEEALRHRFLPEKVYYSPALLGVRGEKLIGALKGRNVACIDVPAKQLQAMAGTETPQGAVGTFIIPERELTKLYRREYRKLLWCENIADPGNLGTLIRSALAFGFDLVVMSGNCAECFSPKVVRASAGAVFGQLTARAANKEVIDMAQQNDIAIVATGIGGKKFDNSLKMKFERGKLILAIGSEAEGLSEEIIRSADLTVKIEHTNRVESLNAAVAGAILMNEFYAQREV